MDAFAAFGMWVARISDTEWQVNPPGLHHTVTRYLEADKPGARMVLDEADAQAAIAALGRAARA